MGVYLVQHGEAKSEMEDPERPLNDKGKEDVGKVAREAKALRVMPSRIVHSGKLRAKQTAEIFAKELSINKVEEAKGLAPKDEPGEAKGLIKESMMIVGHLPHLSRLASSLIVGDPEREIIGFKMGGMVGLSRVEGNWKVSLFLVPSL